MSKIPMPEEFYKAEKKAKLLKNDELKKVLDGMPQKRANLVISTLLNPTATKFEIAKMAGYKIKDSSKTHNLFREIEGKLGKALLQLGITEADILKSLHESLNANKSHIIKAKVKQPNGTYKMEIDIVETPDHTVRLKALETILKLGDYFPATKLNVTNDTTHRVEFGEKMSLKERKAKELELAEKEMIEADYKVTNESVN